MEIKEIKQELETIKAGLEGSISEQVKTNIQKASDDLKKALESGNQESITKAVKDNVAPLNEAIKGLNEWKGEYSAAFKANQEAVDKLIAAYKDADRTSKNEVKSFQEALAAEVAKPEFAEGIKSVGKNRPYRIELKAASPMLVSDHLTGSGQITYNQRQAIYPAQKVNFRDLIRAVHSDTGIYVTYQENLAANQGAIGTQTEGAAKNLVDYQFSNVQTVNQYIAGYARFSKQLVKNLGFFQSTLPVLLLRDFFKQENASFFSAAAGAATGTFSTPSPADNDDVKALIDLIASQMKSSFNASFVLMNTMQWARINKLFYGNLKYPGIGGLSTDAQGTVRVLDVPVIPAPWVTDEKALIIDTDFIERVEVESIAVEFFEQDVDNVQKNLITARIECYEALNPMLGASMIYGDFGGNS